MMTSENLNLIIVEHRERIQKLIAIIQRLKEDCQTSGNKANLLPELETMLISVREYEAAIGAFDEALKINPNDSEFGITLGY